MEPRALTRGPRRYRGTRLRDHITADIERQILEGQLKPGDRLPHERALAEQYQVSRAVVRDAIAVLVERGLVEVHPGRGTFVAEAHPATALETLSRLLRRSEWSIGELLEARYFLEIRTAGLAARRAEASDLQAIAAALARMIEHRGRPLAFVRADVAFHEAVAAAAKNRVLSSYLACIRELLVEAMLAGTALPQAMDNAIAAHTAILEAIRQRDERAAQAAMRAHLQQSYEEIVAVGYIAPAEGGSLEMTSWG